jgi:hypothetical protein
MTTDIPTFDALKDAIYERLNVCFISPKFTDELWDTIESDLDTWWNSKAAVTEYCSEHDGLVMEHAKDKWNMHDCDNCDSCVGEPVDPDDMGY